MTRSEAPAEGETVPVLLFMSGGRRYGIRLSRVREVAEIESIEAIEGRSGDCIGVMVLRDEPVPLMVVGPAGVGQAGAGQGGAGEEERPLPFCIVLQSGAAVVGLAVERILGIRRFRPERTLTGLGADERPQQAFLDQEGRLIQAVDADRWFAAQPTLPLLADLRAVKPPAERQGDPEQARQRYMALAIGEQLFALDSGLVDRAVDDAKVAALPRRPGVRLDSVIEVGGNVLPVLRLTASGFERQSIHIIVACHGQKWAVAAERVLGIVTNESPPRSFGEDAQERVISCKGRFHEVVDVKGLISAQVPDFVRPDDGRA